MKAIKAYTQIYNDINGGDILKKIERCGRVCYKSEGKIEEGSAEKFVSNIIKRGHEAVLEHGSFIFEIDGGVYQYLKSIIEELEDEYEFQSFLRFTKGTRYVVSGNVRAWRSFVNCYAEIFKTIPLGMHNFISENPILFPEVQNKVLLTDSIFNFKQLSVSDLVTKNEKLIHQDVTVKFVVDRGISHEIVRHRIASYCQESTRYCNYSKDDFGSEITFIIPEYLNYGTADWKIWKGAMKVCEGAYFQLLNWGSTPQEARAVLPNSLKTEVVMTANLKEWHTFFELRTANAAHPQMREVARPLLGDFRGLFPGIFDTITY